MDIMQEVLKYEEFSINERRHFHEDPELGGHEDRTMAHISELLTGMGIEHDVVKDGGIFGYIHGKKTGKTVLLRADCDALPVEEYKNNLKQPKVCVSKNDSVCHACGHDGHMAALLTAAKILSEHKDELGGDVVLMFERGEEGMHNCIALHRFMEDHKMHVDTCYGNHVYAALESGKIALLDGPVMSGMAKFGYRIIGKGGHGSRPDLSYSPIDCFVAIANAFNALRMKYVSPFNSLTFSIGNLHSGAVLNVIPDDLTFDGTIRFFNLEDGRKIIELFNRVVKDTCDMFDCTYEIKPVGGAGDAVLNDPECAALARKVVGEVIGNDRIVTVEPWMASESFALTQHKWPGVFGLVGIKNEELGSGANHHNGAFDIDESALKYSAAAYVAYAKGFLDSDLDTSEKVFKGTFADIYSLNSKSEKEMAYISGQSDEFPVL